MYLTKSYIPYDEDSDDRLFHHGIKGMKWGVRRDRKAAKTEKVARKEEKKSQIRERNQKVKVRDVKKMSDVEIKKAIDRMNLEKQYNSLQRGRENILLRTGSRVATDLLYELAKDKAKSEIKKKLGW